MAHKEHQIIRIIDFINQMSSSETKPRAVILLST